jgi:NTP pyrophosphatase (non-canonical NTP hydrolase)
VSNDIVDVGALKKQLREFCQQRDWMHVYTVRNLAMAASVEMGEVLEILQWLTEDELKQLTEEKTQQMADEIADTMNNLVMLADVLGIHVQQAIANKIQKNAEKYPVG